ncbi:hypothetical protein [Singulisphaera acidiphila]|uniref:Uncharacterized protein n=1 Tax=Singulisphaera acidiphila (strain ATCC BAA-1392 / DSM 18658 / VKM B-2454 / MOB10) TaxID=886293 RepID=L0DJ57_SINAD|nr:hypothetical protein [Singulisphaera acidiphila]AGA28711.1 hypothetical protein Sinac_4529 [Singulisphaera acidiphila DSM 18658]
MSIPAKRNFTLRWMIALVAVSAAVCWYVNPSRTRHLAEQYEVKAYRFSLYENLNRDGIAQSRTASGATTCRKRAKYFAAMRAKYERASHYPWLPIAPDPPVPE